MQESNFKLEAIACPICGCDQHKPWKTFAVKRRLNILERLKIKEREFDYVECQTCKHHYMNPAPNMESLSNYYGGEYFSEDGEAKHNQLLNISLSDEFYFRTCRNLPQGHGKSLLEIGPGTGKYMVWAQNRGYRVFGYDLAQVEMCKEVSKESMQWGSLEDCHYEDKQFDVISSHWVFEHLLETRPTMEAAARWLKDDGELVISVPNANCWDANFFGEYWHHSVVPDHISQFNLKSLEKMMENHGFEIVKCQYDLLSFDTILSLGYWLKDKWGIPNFMQSLPFQLAVLPLAPLKSWLKQSGNLTVTAKKVR